MKECVSHHAACDCREAAHARELAEVRAEVERLKAQLGDAHFQRDEAVHFIDEWRAVAEKREAEAAALREERDALQAETEKWKSIAEQRGRNWAAEVARTCDARDAAEHFRAEAGRLRAGLESIARSTCCEGCNEAKRVAKNALDPKPVPGTLGET